MKKINIFLWSAINSLGVFIYTSLVALLMTNGEKLFGSMNNLVGGVAILMLFILSAAVVGSLIIAKPLMLYLDGHKEEALRLLMYTIFSLFIITLVIFVIYILLK